MRKPISRALLSLLAAVAFVRADEGMYPYQSVPTGQIQARYGFKPDQKFLDHLRQASVRFPLGGSGSFVSQDGLVMTNHHVAFECVQQLSSVDKNYVKDGFKAVTRDEEKRCPGMTVQVLRSMMDVTGRIRAAKDREAEEKKIKDEAGKGPGKLVEIVSFFSGQEYWLYHYETYDDVRLVMAPENDVGQFGHDQDNFDYPRHGLDMAFVRIYRDGKPVTPSDYLEWSAEGPQKDEPLFVSGHPGGTERYLTVAQLRRQRDQALPLILQALGLQRQALLDIAAESPARSLEVASLLADVDNSIKAYRGGQAGLADPQVWAKKEAQEKALRDAIAADPKLQKKYGRVFGDIERLETRSAADFRERVYRGVVHGTGAQLPELAAALLQSAKEIAKTKPGERDEARAAAIEAIQEKFEHLVSVPGFQEKALTASLELSRRVLGDKDPFVRDVLSGRTPAEAARAAVGATRIADPAEWARLLAGDASAALHSADPVFALARAIEHHAAPLRERHEREVTRPEEKAKNLLGAAWRAAYGAALYPDADFTLRLSYGQMRGFETRGKELPARTTFFGLFEKNESYENAFPYALPDSVRGCRPGVDLCTPLNFVTDNDIIGGNSGSPMVNRQGRVVGLVFDGNWEGLANEHVFSARDRTIAVDSRAVLHALTHIYKMDALAREIAGTTAARLARMPGAPPQETHD